MGDQCYQIRFWTFGQNRQNGQKTRLIAKMIGKWSFSVILTIFGHFDHLVTFGNFDSLALR